MFTMCRALLDQIGILGSSPLKLGSRDPAPLKLGSKPFEIGIPVFEIGIPTFEFFFFLGMSEIGIQGI